MQIYGVAFSLTVARRDEEMPTVQSHADHHDGHGLGHPHGPGHVHAPADFGRAFAIGDRAQGRFRGGRGGVQPVGPFHRQVEVDEATRRSPAPEHVI